jgi:hypothetical protein
MSEIDAVYKKVVQLVQAQRFKEANTALLPFLRTSNALVFRARYLLSSHKASPSYSAKESKKILDGLCKLNDSWGNVEKGRCLLNGIFYARDTFNAEDFLMRAKDVEPRAVYLLADIHGNGLHRDEDGKQVYDLTMSTEMYLELSKTNTAYKELATINYCRLMMDKGNLSPDDKRVIFNMLTGLMENKQPGAYSLYVNFLAEELNAMSRTLFSSPEGNSFAEKQTETLGKNQYNNAVKQIKKLITNKDG